MKVLRWTAALALGCALRAQAAPQKDKADPATELNPALKQFIGVLSTVQSQAADAQPVDKMIFGGAIPAMLRELDPHTQFFDPAQF